ncbi:hypothetical protein [Celerinatantimonas sp. YJH-8]|uniref:hypothetical protein n=1 Tax=Celerinatantimonas sp. YJH-8 TaxID=3228714 RepID=UPI0038BEA911
MFKLSSGNSNRLGLYLGASQLQAVYLSPHGRRFLPAINLETSQFSVESLCHSPQVLADGLHQLQQQLHRYHGRVSLSLPKSWIETGVISLPRSQSIEMTNGAALCRQHGVAVSDYDCLELIGLAPDIRHPGQHLYRYAWISGQLQGILKALSQSCQWSLTRLDAAIYGLARAWWAEQPAMPGRFAELYVAHIESKLEVGLFLQHRLLDWQVLPDPSALSLQNYLANLAAILARFPGVTIIQVRCSQAEFCDDVSLPSLPIQWQIMTSLCCQNDGHWMAYGAALAL